MDERHRAAEKVYFSKRDAEALKHLVDKLELRHKLKTDAEQK